MSGPIRRILIADGHDILRRGLRHVLESRGCYRVVSESGSGREALAAAKSTSPDIAIVEVSLSDLNGLDLITAMKRDAPKTRILIYSLHNREELVLAALHAGASGYVLKCMSERHLLRALEAISIGRTYFQGVLSDELLARQSERATSVTAALTHREREVIQLIAEGKMNKQVAHVLNISPKTVETHRASSMRKLSLKTAADLIRYAFRNAIAPP